MSAGGVIPEPAARQPHGLRRVGQMEDVDGDLIDLTVIPGGIVRITVTDGSFADLDKDCRDEFMRLWCEAERQAEASDGQA